MLHNHVPGIRDDVAESIEGWVGGRGSQEDAAALGVIDGRDVVVVCCDKGIGVWMPAEPESSAGVMLEWSDIAEQPDRLTVGFTETPNGPDQHSDTLTIPAVGVTVSAPPMDAEDLDEFAKACVRRWREAHTPAR